ncbi:uncharacterized protein LOC119667611 [Teleopsis dalmanni]|uniref:uncharacterized protein LOC119667611 n=1 Tax=Teleopsis dalmanni TaxID=139649 RepID=UPI0018CF2062|nr:uncharacterized protein LOC119667611 [Teleopsis dalmanni]
MFKSLRVLDLKRMSISVKDLANLKQLKELKLMFCKANDTNNLSELFKAVQLTTLIIIPINKTAENNCQDTPSFLLDSINCCTTLEVLKVSAVDLTTAIVEQICQLPLLEKFTVYTLPYVNLKSRMYSLRKILEVVRTLKAVMVRVIRLKCYFEWSLLEEMLHLENLHTFCWHSQFEVYNEADGIEWTAYNPNILIVAVIRFVILHRHRLEVLNFSRNCHASKSFIESVMKKTNLKVIHDDFSDSNKILKPVKRKDDWDQFDCMEFEMQSP